jgi:hypothetical protein
MAIPTTTVRGGLYNPANSAATTRAEAYVSPYIRAGWENWKLSLAEAQAAAESEDSAYKSRLAYYKMLQEAKSDLQAQLARLQETSYKNGADVDKENFSTETKIAIENAGADNTAKRTTVEQAGLGDRAELNADVTVFGTKSRLVGDRLLADAQRENQPPVLDSNAEALVATWNGKYKPGSSPTALKETLDGYVRDVDARGVSPEDRNKGLEVLFRKLSEATPPGAAKDAALDNVALDTTLYDNIQKGALGNKKSSGFVTGPPPAAPGTNLPSRSYSPTMVAKPDPLVAKPADTSDLEAKLAALDAKLKAIDVSAPERKSLIEEARAVYSKNFRGFPGATKAQPKPVATPTPDRLQATKIEAAKKAKTLIDAWNLDIADPLNLERKTKVFKEFEDSEIKNTVDRLFDSKTPKTEAGVIEKQIQSQFENTGQLADAMAYYIYRVKTTRPVAAAPNVPEVKAITVNPPNLNTPY